MAKLANCFCGLLKVSCGGGILQIDEKTVAFLNKRIGMVICMAELQQKDDFFTSAESYIKDKNKGV